MLVRASIASINRQTFGQKNIKSDKDPFRDGEDVDCFVDDIEEGVAQLGIPFSRASMIKKYSMPTFFTPTKSRQAAFQTEAKPKLRIETPIVTKIPIT